ncbi:class I SAM-dependent methyltransferase [Oricola thermophila]|uniref:Class I SAM-dependent methyltransferase n=1 Tax=Oricola thermophila TaxID=2742145 RepID=A0A6N1VD20_9HYPH|nr:class I SAM-dependent methyltransferase [Oricola thermophila]QKV18816.1 class I SAM-dependent methyltransferase [Oricola thermophila]
MGLIRTIKRVFLGFDDGVRKRVIDERNDLDADYYQGLHEKNAAYQTNNWLVDQERLATLIAGKTVMELGCGNGRFTAKAAKTAAHVHGVDWARSPQFDDSPDNVTFVQADALKAELPKADVACSGDVLEHFRPEDIPALVRKLHASAPVNYHVIACYDDKHSHLTVKPKEWWLEQFAVHDPNYRLLNDGTEKREVAIVSNA